MKNETAELGESIIVSLLFLLSTKLQKSITAITNKTTKNAAKTTAQLLIFFIMVILFYDKFVFT